MKKPATRYHAIICLDFMSTNRDTGNLERVTVVQAIREGTKLADFSVAFEGSKVTQWGVAKNLAGRERALYRLAKIARAQSRPQVFGLSKG